MAWNQGNPGQDHKRRPKSKSVVYVVLAFVGIAVCACCVFWITGGQQPEEPKADTGRISKSMTTVNPSISSNATATGVAMPKKQEVDAVAEKERAERVAVIKRRQAKLAEIRKNGSKRRREPYEVFNHSVENRIAAYLVLEPGTPFLLPPRFGERFVEDFKRSCQEPIIVQKEDSEYVQQLKKLMIETKIELCNRMEAGESLPDILSATHLELQKLGAIKSDVMKMTREEIKKNATTAEDVETMIEAANRLLAEKGIAPIKDNPVLHRNLLRLAEKNGVQSLKK